MRPMKILGPVQIHNPGRETETVLTIIVRVLC